jgi:hypothetical protein
MRRKLSIKPEDLDWHNKTNYELMMEHGVSMSYLAVHRRRLAPETIAIPVTHRIEWNEVDWEQSNTQLAKELKCSATTVTNMRHIHAPGTPTGIDWQSVDWTQSTQDIIKQTGAARQTVYYKRLEFAPETIQRRRKVPEHIDWQKPTEVIQAEHGLSKSTIYLSRVRKGLLKPTRQRRAQGQWDRVDWTKPNLQIAGELGVTVAAVSYQRHKLASHIKVVTIWDRIDWTQSDADIARITNKTLGAVKNQRAKRTRNPSPRVVEPVKKKRPQPEM